MNTVDVVSSKNLKDVEENSQETANRIVEDHTDNDVENSETDRENNEAASSNVEKVKYLDQIDRAEYQSDLNAKTHQEKISPMDDVMKKEKETTTLKDSLTEKYQHKCANHVSYLENGTAIYTDPETNFKYKWSDKTNLWTPTFENHKERAEDPYENEHYKWCSKSNLWVLKEMNENAKQQAETEFYRWDAEKNEWIPKQQQTTSEVSHTIDKDGQTTYTDTDGVVFFWDTLKKAWFPKIDDDFMARYQMNYGFVNNVSSSNDNDLEAKQSEIIEDLENSSSFKRKLPKEPPKWFEISPEQNTKVYVSNLPLDITIEEFSDVMSKCGMIMRDPKTQKLKLKLYTEADGQVKGDGLCDYIKVESVDLALKILDEYDVRGHKIRVQRATFQMRGEYNPALKPKRLKKEKEKLQKIKDKLFDWRPEKMRGERSKNEKVVIIKNLFSPELFDKEMQLIIDYQKDLREECSKCGTVKKVVIYDRHPDGVAQVNMSSPEEADLIIKIMNGRFFGKRKLIANQWDGKTNFKIAECETEMQKRLNNWDRFLGEEERKNSAEQCYTEHEGTANDQSAGDLAQITNTT